MHTHQSKFNALLGVKTEPNNHEKYLFERGKAYIQKLSKIPGIEMIAIVNSLSMYATHKNSDIDLFIITQPNMLWFVRLFSTLILWKHGVWRKNEDIAGNLCLSFFVTTEAMNLSNIAIEDDIYLYNWIYHLKPVIVEHDTYKKFLKANNWVKIEDERKIENQKYILSPISFFTCEFCVSIREYFHKKFQTVGAKAHPNGISNATESQRGSFGNLENRAENRYQNAVEKIKTFGTFSHKSTGNGVGLNKFYIKLNQIIRLFLLPKTIKSYKKLGKPEGIIVSDTMLKFHNHDRRREIRDTIFEKNFDK